MTTLLFYLPSDILHSFIDYFDNKTILRFLSTCTFLYEQEIKCNKILIKDNNMGHPTPYKLKWIIDLSDIKKNDGKKILLTTKILREYFKICKYKYLYIKFWRNNYKLEIVGVFTNVPGNILKPSKICSCGSKLLFEIIDHNTYTQIIFTKGIYNCLSFFIESKEYFLSAYRHSEIIKARHSIYFEINFPVEHTASKNIEIESKPYFLSCYTAPLI